MKCVGVVTFAYRSYKSGATHRAPRVNVLLPALRATSGVAGSMRREETKYKKPLAGTQLPAIVQPNPFELPQPSGGGFPPLLAWDQAVGSVFCGAA